MRPFRLQEPGRIQPVGATWVELPQRGTGTASVLVWEFACDVSIGVRQDLDAPAVGELNRLQSHHLEPCIDALLNGSIACRPSPSLNPVAWRAHLRNLRTPLTSTGCLPFPLLRPLDTASLLRRAADFALGDGLLLGLLNRLFFGRRDLRRRLCGNGVFFPGRL